jgi:protein-tyrosine phosphatase
VSAPALDMSRLSPHLLAGRIPFARSHVEALRAAGVTAVVNLCQADEYWAGERDEVLDAYAEAGITEHHLPVPDGSTVPPQTLSRAVELTRGETVYVHCRGGRERSGAVAAAIVVAADGLAVDEALARVRDGRPAFAPLPWQVDALRAWAAGERGSG